MTHVLTTQNAPAADAALKRLIAPFGIDLEFCPPNGSVLLHRLQAKHFAAVVLRSALDDITPYALLTQYRLNKSNYRLPLLLPLSETLFFALLPGPDAKRRQMLLQAGFTAVLTMPVSEYRLATVISNHIGAAQLEYLNREADLRKECAALLVELGMPCHLKGFPFLCEALVFLAANPDALYQMTKVLYPHVAQCMGTSAGNAERNMRTALDALLRQGDPEKIAAYLPVQFSEARACGGCRSRGRACTSELLAALSQCLQQRRSGGSLRTKQG